MSRREDDEFFIGYAPPMPPSVATFVRRIVLALVAASLVAAAVFAVGHMAIDGGRFEFGHPIAVAGTIAETPYPSVRMDGARSSRVLLVAPGKHGADRLVQGLDGRHVRFAGTRIERGTLSMLEIEPASLVVAEIAGPSASDQSVSTPGLTSTAERPRASDIPAEVVADRVALTGEVVDSKCFLGVMVPGSGKTHKDCASLCLRGGIPPALWVVDRSGHSSLLLMTGRSGEAIGERAWQLAGEPIVVTGSVRKQGDWLELRSDPETWRLVDP